MKDQTTSITSIAQHLGVSKSTVHRALSGHGAVKASLRATIVQMADTLGYQPNPFARSLRLQRSFTIGVITGFSGISSMYQVMEEAAEAQGYRTIITPLVMRTAAQEERALAWMLERRVDGVILITDTPRADDSAYDRLLAAGIPIVFQTLTEPRVAADWVTTDNELGGYLAAQHLLNQRRQRLALVFDTSGLDQPTWTWTWQADRLRGCERAITEMGAFPLLHLGTGNAEDGWEDYGYHAVRAALIAGDCPFDALVAINDAAAYGAIQALRERGLRIPDDVAILGFDNTDWCDKLQPPLTSLAFPARELARAAMQSVFTQLNRGEEPYARHVVKIAPSLIIRASCGGTPTPSAARLSAKE
ncbi:MAG TPA: LacI family DNA-binding transcriptional regulator [Armatimonadota bacterium]